MGCKADLASFCLYSSIMCILELTYLFVSLGLSSSLDKHLQLRNSGQVMAPL